MTATVAGADAPPTAAGRRTGRPGLLLLASIVVSFLASSSAPTPLYAAYSRAWGLSPITTTVVFATYAIAVLGALLVFGRVSDHVGRRPVLLAALIVQAGAMIALTTADGLGVLIAGRVLQGLATGSAVGALGAAMIDIDRVRGTLANSVSPALGTGLGALVSGLVVEFLPAPTHLIYLALLVVVILQAVGVLLLPETVTRKPGVAAALVPEISVPEHLRGPVLAATPALFAIWALAGFYGALSPALARALSGSSSEVIGGLGLFVLAGTAALTVLALDRIEARVVMTVAMIALIVGVGGSLAAVEAGSVAGFFVATIVSGLGFGAGFLGGIRTVVPRARPHERAGVLSVLYVVSYLGFGVPAVVAGVLVVHGGGLVDTARYYTGFVVVLAVLALIGLARTRRSAAV